MAVRTYFGNRAAVSLALKGGTEVKQLVVQDFSAEFNVSIEDLYGLGSIVRQDVARHSGKVDVSFKVFKVDPLSGTENLSKIITGAGTSTAGEISSGVNDTSKVQFYTMKVYLDSDETTTLTAVIDDVVFDKFPVGGDDKSWIGFEFSGTGASFKLVEAAPPS